MGLFHVYHVHGPSRLHNYSTNPTPDRAGLPPLNVHNRFTLNLDCDRLYGLQFCVASRYSLCLAVVGDGVEGAGESSTLCTVVSELE